VREPARVARDVSRGYYTRNQARHLFRVVLEEDGIVDRAATNRLRQAAQNDRA
jgi:N-methylhydantoinase B/oxoprolinase/acetone carboxylase alpha subunit